ncbi:hypothetical protein [Jongsikchunia kroppenstedtii]|uniref:hypothetical protein n=1 Tax=Jongsikchunia kroppenstedtii TaxID=1121721 RepID=UPI00037DA21A|nr:hypothetical protein [Jongsikchunia kroppenstedtii]
MSPGGKTPWPATSVDGILDIGLSMDSGGAADAAAKLRAAMQAIANAAALYERTVQTLAEHLEGEATTAALTTAGRVARAAVENASNTGAVGGQLEEVAAILHSGRSTAQTGVELIGTTAARDMALVDNAELARAIKAQLDAAMDSTYSNPMVGAHDLVDVTPVNDLDIPGGPGAGDAPGGTAFGGGGSATGSDPADPAGMLSGPVGSAPDRTAGAAASPNAAGQAEAGSPVTDAAAAGAGSAGSGPSTTMAPAGGAGPLGPIGGVGTTRGGSPTGRVGGAAGVGGIGAAQPVPSSRLTTPGVTAKPPTPPVPGTASPSAPRGTTPPMHPGGGRSSARGNEHRRAAGYLRGRHHSETAIGPLPLVAPPVLGDWAAPDAATDPEKRVDSAAAQRDQS